MKKAILFSVSFLILAGIFSTDIFASHQITKWQGNHAGAISLTFDDGSLSQFNNGAALLNARNLKGTFFLISSYPPHQGVTWEQWGQLAAQGHEIGSHSVTHPDLTQLPVAQVIQELSQSQQTINSNIPSQSCISFGYPYCAVNAQVESLASAYYFATRACGVPFDKGGGYLNHYDTAGWWSAMDFYSIAGYPISESDNGDYSAAQDLHSYLSAAEEYNAWFIPYIHEIPDSKINFYNQFVDDLLRRNLWIAPFGKVARYMKEKLSSNLAVLSESNTEVKLTLTHSLDNSIYDQPLTIRSTVPSNWSKVMVQQGESVYFVTPIAEGAENIVYYDALPNVGIITLSEGGTLLQLNFEEGSGNTALDSSGYGNHGTINGAVYTTDGAVGSYALSYNGNSSVAVPGNGSLNGNNMSIAIWVKHMSDTSSPNYGGIIQGAYGDGYHSGFRILDYYNQPLAQINFGDSGPIWILGNGFVQDAWCQIVLTYDHANIRLYQNGALIREIAETRDINWDPNPDKLYIGWAQWYFHGLIDKVENYNYALNAQEIGQLYGEETAVPYKVTTNPAGFQIAVDGVAYTAPQTFNWVVGSTHTLSVPSPQGKSPGTWYGFDFWSDGGAQTHTITAPLSGTTYAASFNLTANSTLLELNFEEGSGNTALDSSGYGNHGTINGAVYTADGAVGSYGLSYNGNSSVTVPGNESIKPYSLSVALWVKHVGDTSSGNYGGIIQGAHGDGYHTGFRVLDYYNQPLAEVNFGDAGPTWIYGNPFVPEAWTHIVLTYDHAKIRLYQNGALIREITETRDINWDPNPDKFYIGWGQWYFKGSIDKVKMYGYALSSQEVTQLYNEMVH